MSSQIPLKDVMMNKSVFVWMRELAKGEPSAFVRLSGENRKRLVRILGAPERYFKTIIKE